MVHYCITCVVPAGNNYISMDITVVDNISLLQRKELCLPRPCAPIS